MKIRKAVITAAKRDQHSLLIQTFLDRDGAQKSALRIILEEAQSAGIEEVCVVVCPGDEPAFRIACGDWEGTLRFVEQTEPLGYGHALYCSREFVLDEMFLHFVSDHLYLSSEKRRCAQQLVEVAMAEECAVSAVQATRESMLPYYGVISGKGVPGRPRLYQIDKVIEKPTPTEAEQQLIVPGLRSGHYLCFFGMHVLTPAVMQFLAEQIEASGSQAPFHLSPALSVLARKENYLAYEVAGRRFNMGVKLGVLTAQLALALEGQDREEVLAQLVELLAARKEP